MNHSYLHECEFNISFVSSKSFLACWKLSLTLILFILKYFYSFFSKFSISFLLIFYHFSFLCIQSQKRSSLTVLLSLVFNMIFLLSSVSDTSLCCSSSLSLLWPTPRIGGKYLAHVSHIKDKRVGSERQNLFTFFLLLLLFFFSLGPL